MADIFRCGLAIWVLSIGTPIHAQDRDCIDFRSWEDAQDFFRLSGVFDPHNLDRDRDGIVCEALKLVGIWNFHTVCLGRDLAGTLSIQYRGGRSYSGTIRNNYGEHSDTRLSAIYPNVYMKNWWDNGSVTTANSKVDHDWTTMRGQDSLGCEFIAYKQ